MKISFFGDGRTLVTIHFRSDDADSVQRATACEAAIWNEMLAAGFPPYRVSIDQIAPLGPLVGSWIAERDPSYSQTGDLWVLHRSGTKWQLRPQRTVLESATLDVRPHKGEQWSP